MLLTTDGSHCRFGVWTLVAAAHGPPTFRRSLADLSLHSGAHELTVLPAVADHPDEPPQHGTYDG